MFRSRFISYYFVLSSRARGGVHSLPAPFWAPDFRATSGLSLSLPTEASSERDLFAFTKAPATSLVLPPVAPVPHLQHLDPSSLRVAHSLLPTSQGVLPRETPGPPITAPCLHSSGECPARSSCSVNACLRELPCTDPMSDPAVSHWSASPPSATLERCWPIAVLGQVWARTVALKETPGGRMSGYRFIRWNPNQTYNRGVWPQFLSHGQDASPAPGRARVLPVRGSR